jgi:AraC family transcriptional regulator of adaptative response / DNA-3-methyladenine glycosylase II
VTVAGARTLTERLIAAFGEDVAGAPEGLSRAFPRAARLADAGAASIAKIGLPRKRAETLHRLALASADGKLPLHRGAIATGRAALSAMPGVGPWTIEYVALRALGDPDAFPASDAAIIAVLGAGDELEELRPWRAYAAVRLWRRASQRNDMKGPKP